MITYIKLFLLIFTYATFLGCNQEKTTKMLVSKKTSYSVSVNPELTQKLDPKNYFDIIDYIKLESTPKSL